MNKYLVIINKFAGKGRVINSLPKLSNFFTNHPSKPEVVYTQYPKHATEYVATHGSDFNFIVSVGGDGTLNEVVNGILLNGARPTVGVIPIGSGNDFAYNLNLLRDKLTSNLTYLFSKEPVISEVDIGSIQIKNDDEVIVNRYFINCCGVGFDAFVAYLNQSQLFFKGNISYIISIFKALMQYKPIIGTLTLDKSLIFDDQKLFVAVGNGVRAGGGLYLTPRAVVDDNFLDASIVDFIPRLKLVRKLPLALFNKLERVKEAQFYKFKEFYLNLKSPAYVHADGEILSNRAKEISINLQSKRLNFIRQVN